jgi:hypothetical protein
MIKNNIEGVTDEENAEHGQNPPTAQVGQVALQTVGYGTVFTLVPTNSSSSASSSSANVNLLIKGFISSSINDGNSSNNNVEMLGQMNGGDVGQYMVGRLVKQMARLVKQMGVFLIK